MAEVGEGWLRLMKDEFGALCTVAEVVKRPLHCGRGCAGRSEIREPPTAAILCSIAAGEERAGQRSAQDPRDGADEQEQPASLAHNAYGAGPSTHDCAQGELRIPRRGSRCGAHKSPPVSTLCIHRARVGAAARQGALRAAGIRHHRESEEIAHPL
eukprot:gene17696-biopygen13698